MDSIGSILSNLAITCVLIGIIYNNMISKISKSEAITSDHEKRIQKVEDIHGNKIDSIITGMDRITIEVRNLAAQINKDKNQDNAINATMIAILKHLDNNQ